VNVPVARWGAVIVLLAALASCSSDADPDEEGGDTTTTESTVPTPTITGDGSAFCEAMLAVGRVAGANGASTDEVLAANEELVRHLDEAQTNTPSDAPPDFDSLLDDYRLAAEAIFAAEGDVAAAFDALGEDHPEVVDRLASSTSHADAYAFLVDRCGIAAPGGTEAP
jgi:hypothetical protein